MKAKAYYLLRRMFSQPIRNRLKATKYNLSRKLAPFKKKLYGSFTVQELQQEIQSKLKENFEVLVVHSSYSSLLPMYQGNLSELLQMLLTVSEGKTLVMPAFFFGDRKYNYDVLKHFKNQPKFDIVKTPSQMGFITEMFRKTPGVSHSCHPTHRISALGPLAEVLVSNHHLCRTGCGEGSPFDKMARFNTKVLGLGTRYYQCMTQTHSPEDLLIEQGTYPTRFELNQVAIEMTYKNNWRFEHKLTWPDKTPYRRVLHPFLRSMLDTADMFEWKYRGAHFFIADATKVQQVLISAALEGRSAYK